MEAFQTLLFKLFSSKAGLFWNFAKDPTKGSLCAYEGIALNIKLVKIQLQQITFGIIK